MGETIFIGDVHGCYEELIALLKKVSFDKNNDRLIFLGDLVHKGPDSAKVIEFVYQNSYEMILGNHDDYFLKALDGFTEPYDEFDSIVSDLSTPVKNISHWLNSLPVFINEKEFLTVHAGLDPMGDCILNKQGDVCMNIRYWDQANSKFSTMTSRDKKGIGDLVAWYEMDSTYFEQHNRIIYGHWAKKEVQFSENHRIIGIDTGCCYGGRLTAYLLNKNKLVQVESLQKKQFDY